MKTPSVSVKNAGADGACAAVGSMPSEILEQAIAWAVRLRSGAAGDQERAAWTVWRGTDPLHEQAWQQVEAVDQAFRDVPALPGRIAYTTLQQAAVPGAARKPGRRRALKLLGWCAVGAATALLASTQIPWQRREVHATAIGERRRIVLADGTHLQLNTASGVEVVFSPLRRLIVLTRGEIAIETGRDADSFTGRRPFWVETAHARLEAIGTRFSVRRTAADTHLHVFEGTVAIHAAGTAPVLARAGSSFLIAASAPPVRIVDDSFDAAGWMDGVLVAKQMRLDAFIAELARYHETPLRCAPSAAELRVSGVFQLDGPGAGERILEILRHTLPIKLLSEAGGAVTITGS